MPFIGIGFIIANDAGVIALHHHHLGMFVVDFPYLEDNQMMVYLHQGPSGISQLLKFYVNLDVFAIFY